VCGQPNVGLPLCKLRLSFIQRTEPTKDTICILFIIRMYKVEQAVAIDYVILFLQFDKIQTNHIKRDSDPSIVLSDSYGIKQDNMTLQRR
jgi:hypothetical protein